MGASKEYYLKLSEQSYNELNPEEKIYLSKLGMEVRQLPTDDDLQNDEKVKLYKREIAKSYENLNNYLFEKRNG